MKNALRQVLRNLVPLLLATLFFGVYLWIICGLARNSDKADLICFLKWKDGLILLISYAVVNILIGPVLSIHMILPRIISTLLLYNIGYALIALPYWVASIFNYLDINCFFHTLGMILLSEGIVYYLRQKRLSRS